MSDVSRNHKVGMNITALYSELETYISQQHHNSIGKEKMAAHDRPAQGVGTGGGIGVSRVPACNRMGTTRMTYIVPLMTIAMVLFVFLSTPVEGFLPAYWSPSGGGRSTSFGPSDRVATKICSPSPTLLFPPRTTPSGTTTSLDAGGMASILASAALRGGGGGAAAAAAAAAARNMALVASGGPGDVAAIVVAAYDWCTNLGNPSALVAGAVVATLYENMSSGSLDVKSKDRPWVRFGKRLTRVLLLSAFASEVISIFVTTVTGTVLLSKTLDFMDELVPITVDTTPLQFLRENFEFEFLTARITFLQGLVNWLAAIGIGHFIPNNNSNNGDVDGDVDDDLRGTEVGRAMSKFIGCSMLSCITVMLAFYNKHLDYYHNIGHMYLRWGQLLFHKYVFKFPIQPMLFLYVPSIIATVFFGAKAFADREGGDKPGEGDDGGGDRTEVMKDILESSSTVMP